MHNHHKQQLERIDQEMALPSFDFLAAIIAPFRPTDFGSLHALAIDDRGRWGRRFSRLLTHLIAQSIMHVLDASIASPDTATDSRCAGGRRWH